MEKPHWYKAEGEQLTLDGKTLLVGSEQNVLRVKTELNKLQANLSTSQERLRSSQIDHAKASLERDNALVSLGNLLSRHNQKVLSLTSAIESLQNKIRKFKTYKKQDEQFTSFLKKTLQDHNINWVYVIETTKEELEELIEMETDEIESRIDELLMAQRRATAAIMNANLCKNEDDRKIARQKEAEVGALKRKLLRDITKETKDAHPKRTSCELEKQD